MRRGVTPVPRGSPGAEAGAVPALRQSLLDLAAISEALAEELPRPSV